MGEAIFYYVYFGFYLFIIILSIFIYFIPTIIACKKDHKNKMIIFVVNLLSGYSIIGWIVSFVWALSNFDIKNCRRIPTIAEEIEELNKLKEKGIITEEEFNNKKTQLLNSDTNTKETK